MASAVLRLVLFFGLLLLIMSLFALAIVPRDEPGFIPAVLAVAANAITVGAAGFFLRRLIARQAREEQQAQEQRWDAFGEHVADSEAELTAGARPSPNPSNTSTNDNPK